jgi:hypothetical protein
VSPHTTCQKVEISADRFGTSRDKNSLWYMFEEAALDAKGADCLVCEGLTLSWDQVYRREYRSR